MSKVPFWYTCVGNKEIFKKFYEIRGVYLILNLTFTAGRDKKLNGDAGHMNEWI